MFFFADRQSKENVTLSQNFVFDDDFNNDYPGDGAASTNQPEKESQSILEETRGEKEKNPVRHDDSEVQARQVK